MLTGQDYSASMQTPFQNNTFRLIGLILKANVLLFGFCAGGYIVFMTAGLYGQTHNIFVAFFLAIMFAFVASLFSLSSQCSSYNACLPVPLYLIAAVATAIAIAWFIWQSRKTSA